MFFSTRQEWQDNREFTARCENDYRAIKFYFNIYYYQVTVCPDNDHYIGATFLFGHVEDALGLLNSSPGSTLLLQVPAFLNRPKSNKEPGLYTIAAIYKSTDPVAQPYFAETVSGDLFCLFLDEASSSLDLSKISKEIIWSAKTNKNS